LNRIENAELCLGYAIEKRPDTTATVHEGLPVGVLMDPSVFWFLVGKKDLAIVFDGQKWFSLRSGMDPQDLKDKYGETFTPAEVRD
jgi:hypothetical protein